MLQNPHVLLTFDKVHNSLASATRNDIWTSKSGPKPLVFFYILTSTCAWRHNGVHIFDISTSKNGLNPWCFTFWLRNVLRATTACTFSTSPLLKVLRTPRAFYILTSKCASRHTACTFSTSQLPKVLRSWSVCFAPQRRALFPHPNF